MRNMRPRSDVLPLRQPKSLRPGSSPRTSPESRWLSRKWSELRNKLETLEADLRAKSLVPSYANLPISPTSTPGTLSLVSGRNIKPTET